MNLDGLCIRTFPSELEVEGDGRTVIGLLAPYNQRALVDDGFGPYWEEFLPGCFEKCIGHGNANYLRVQLEHNGHWVGRGQAWLDGPKGLSAELRLDDTEAGREAAFKIHDGQTPGLSLGFRPYAGDRRKFIDGKPVVQRKKIKALHHVALCAQPAYANAKVTAVREAPVAQVAERVAYWQEWTQRMRRT
jgi:HK97 family phage prohead protease